MRPDGKKGMLGEKEGKEGGQGGGEMWNHLRGKVGASSIIWRGGGNY